MFTQALPVFVQIASMVGFDREIGGVSQAGVFNTPDGLVPLDWLKSGDLIETMDQGFQAIARIDPVDADRVVPLGGGVMAGQGVLAAGWPIEMYFGYDEMLAVAGDIAGVGLIAPDGCFAQVVMANPALLRLGDVWIDSHAGANPLHPVLSATETALVKQTFGCPMVLCSDAISELAVVSTTFGSHAIAA